MKKLAGKSLEDFAAAHDPTAPAAAHEAVFSRPLPKDAKRFIVTAAQNATPAHPEWWEVLVNMAKAKGAELLVIPLRYKNPTSQWTGSQQNAEHWDAVVRPYLWNVRHALNVNLTLLADIKTQPTASSPLTGFDAVSLASSGIVGHTKMQLRSIPTPSGRMAKVLTTSGACTLPNYTDSKAGKIGEFHHSLSAVLVELDGKRFHLRQLHFDKKTKSCTDLDTRFFATHTDEAPRPLALILGDTHVDAIDPAVERATFGKDGMVATLKPEKIVHHDLLDAYSVNGHHYGNPFNAIAKQRSGMNDAAREVRRAIDFVAERTPKDTTSIIVSSNHDDMLRRYIVAQDWRTDPTNAEFYLETALAMVRETKMGDSGTEYPSPFPYWVSRRGLKNVECLPGGASLLIGGIECGMHGDRGPNGARGSIRNLQRIGVKSVIGHSHSPGISEGAYQVGTSSRLKLEYNSGPSSWLHAHCLIHADGKRQLVLIVDGKWRATS